MQKNVSGQRWAVYAYQDEGGANPGEPVTGDAANITANLRIDGGAANAVDDTNPTELEDGFYYFDITQTETNGEMIVICPASSTANVNVVGAPAAVFTTPANFPDFSITATDGRVDVDAISGTTQTANDVGADVNAILDDTGTSGVIVATNSDKTGYRLSATGVDDIWDEPTSGHTTSGSFGQVLYIARANTAQAGASTTITLDASASSTDDFYNNNWIFITGGTGAGQGNTISDYNGTTKVATVQDSWATNPDATSAFIILPRGGLPGASAPTAAAVADAVWDEAYADHTSEGSYGSLLQASHEGTAQSGSTSTVVLDATGSSTTDDFYNYDLVTIIAGTGAGQTRQVADYVGSSRTVTVGLDWTTAPDATSQYVITKLGIDAATTGQVADAVWDEARSGHVTAGTFGEYVLADSIRVSGSATAADLLEAATSGANPLPSNVTQVGGSAEDLPTATALATVDANVDAILVDTDTTIPGLIAALNDITVSDVLTTQMTEAYATDGTAPTLAQALFAIQQFLFDKDQSGTTLTIRQLDGTTAAMTFTLDDADNPTDMNRTA